MSQLCAIPAVEVFLPCHHCQQHCTQLAVLFLFPYLGVRYPVSFHDRIQNGAITQSINQIGDVVGVWLYKITAFYGLYLKS